MHLLEMDCRIPMRDGVALMADVHRAPNPLGGTVLIRTPYGRHEFHAPSRFPIDAFLGAGFHVVVQDLRGKHGSGGIMRVGCDSRQDTIDTLDWLVAQSWCDGQVGMWGCSYVGETQIYAAATRHPALKAIIPMAAGGAPGRFPGWTGRFGLRHTTGILMLESMARWYARHGPGGAADHGMDEAGILAMSARVGERVLQTSYAPADLLAGLGIDDSAWREDIARPDADAHWTGHDYLHPSEPVDVPGLFIDSWYDPGLEGTLTLWRHFLSQPGPAAQSCLIIAPSCHCQMALATENTLVGERRLGDARLDWNGIYIDWFRRWLRGDAASRPPVQWFHMGRSLWQQGDSWPPQGVVESGLDLGTGAEGLQLTPVQHEPGVAELSFDPADPCPTVGGPGFGTTNEGAVDQRRLAARADVLIWRGPVLTEALDLIGRPTAQLWIEADTADLDVHVRLVEATAEGPAWNLCEGLSRTDVAGPTPICLTVLLGSIAQKIAPGNRLELHVSLSSWPAWERNLGGRAESHVRSGGPVVRARLLMGGQTRSQLRLVIGAPG